MEAAASVSEKQANKKKQTGINWSDLRELGVATIKIIGVAAIQGVVGTLAARSVNMAFQRRNGDNVLPMKRSV